MKEVIVMKQEERLDFLIKELLKEASSDNIKIPEDTHSRKAMLRGLMNARLPQETLNESFFRIQDEYLQEEMKAKGITKLSSLAPVKKDIYLWQGDITLLAADAIVNAANSRMLGCFIPNHRCIDNAIHTFAGMQLREKCNEIMKMQGFPEPAGKAKITPAYNLPSKFVIHTAGPVVSNKLTQKDCSLLKSCYVSCLNAAIENNLESIAFCCISTGEFHFPNEEAAHIAVQSVKEFKEKTSSKIRVIFNVFKDIGFEIYREVIGNEFIQ